MRELYDKIVISILVFQVVMLTVKNAVFCNYNTLANYNGIANIVLMVVTIIMLGGALLFRIRRIYITRFSIFALIAIILFYIVSTNIHPVINRYNATQSTVMDFLTYSFLAILLLPTVYNTDLIIKSFYKYTPLMIFACVLSFFLFRLNGSRDINGLTYSMAFGKNAGFLCLIMLSKFFNTKKIIYIIEAVVVTLMILLIGSRYPLLYIFTYFAAEYLIRTKMGPKKIAICGVAIIALFSFPLWQNEFFNLVVELFNKTGMNSRTLSLLINGNITLDSGRNMIHNKIIQGVNNSPIWGYGFGGSIMLLNGEYAHGFVYDVFGTFGYFIGCIIILVSFAYIISGFIKEYKTDTGEIMILFMSAFFPTILIQDDFWSVYRYWWLIIIAYIIRKTRRDKNILANCREV